LFGWDGRGRWSDECLREMGRAKTGVVEGINMSSDAPRW
jgi:hypothetical protein